jgi:hypothetical protein
MSPNANEVRKIIVHLISKLSLADEEIQNKIETIDERIEK